MIIEINYLREIVSKSFRSIVSNIIYVPWGSISINLIPMFFMSSMIRRNVLDVGFKISRGVRKIL